MASSKHGSDRVAERDPWRLQFDKLLLGTAGIILLTKMTMALVPHGWYFSFAAFLFGFPNQIELPAIIVKFSIPIIAGLLIGTTVADNPSTTAAAAGFLSAFILAWPLVTSWELHVPLELIDRRNAFYFMYLFYFASYAYLAKAGARAGSACRAYRVVRKLHLHQGSLRLDWQSTVKPTVLGVVSSAIFYALQKILTS